MSEPIPPSFVAIATPEQPKQKKVTPYVVKITMHRNGAATVESKDKKFSTVLSNATVAVRFHKGEREGYFKVDLDEHGILEIGDRTTPKDPW